MLLFYLQVFGCAISPDGTLVATGSNDKSLCVTNIATQAKVYSVKCDGIVRKVAVFFIRLFCSDHNLRCGVWRGRPTGRDLLP